MHKYDLYEKKKKDENEVNLPFASFPRRIAAFIIDAAILGLIVYLSSLAMFPVLVEEGIIEQPSLIFPPDYPTSLWAGIWVLLYHTMLESSGVRATPGKKIMKLEVVDKHGDRIRRINAMKRSWPLWLPLIFNFHWLLFFVFAVACAIAGVSIAFDKRRQGIHDNMAGCYIIKV